MRQFCQTRLEKRIGFFIVLIPIWKKEGDLACDFEPYGLGVFKSDFSSQVKPQVKSRAQKFCQVKS